MQFVALMAVVVVATIGAFALLLPYCVGVDRLRLAVDGRAEFRSRLVAVAPFVGGLAVVLLLNKGLLERIERFSRRYGVDATATIYAIEGDLVAWIQSVLPEWGLYYFGPMYVLGYVVLLVFPLVGYLFADTLRPLKTLVAAYAVNYAVAILAYASVLAYGPRNYHRLPGADPDAPRVEEPMLDAFREVTQLTARVNVETNVFPSLHTSLSVTVLLVALSTHEQFPRWTVVAAVLAASIVLSTMYLGIHWAIDVVAGVLLAFVSVAVAGRIVENAERRSAT